MIDEFNSINWHDAVVYNIIIDRYNPGIRDAVVVSGCWSNGCPMGIRFDGVYWLGICANMGIVADESIQYAECVSNSEKIQELRSKWKQLDVDLDVYQYNFEFNSTASTISVIAKSAIFT